MDKLYDYLKNTFVTFKLDTCCRVAPVRVGLLIIGYFNVIISLISLVGTADDAYGPPLMAVQAAILDDDPSKPFGVLAYATELAFNILLLSGIYRKDIKLLWVYMYFVFGSIISSVLVYSVVFGLIKALIKTLIICNLVFQCYVIVLVRSAIVEIKETTTSEKNGHVTLYSVRVSDEPSAQHDENHEAEVIVEPPTLKKEEPQQNEGLQSEQNKDNTPSKLETISEHQKDN